MKKDERGTMNVKNLFFYFVVPRSSFSVAVPSSGRSAVSTDRARRVEAEN